MHRENGTARYNSSKHGTSLWLVPRMFSHKSPRIYHSSHALQNVGMVSGSVIHITSDWTDILASATMVHDSAAVFHRGQKVPSAAAVMWGQKDDLIRGTKHHSNMYTDMVIQNRDYLKLCI